MFKVNIQTNPTKEITKRREEEEPNISWFVNTNRRGIRLRIIQMQAPMLFSKQIYQKYEGDGVGTQKYPTHNLKMCFEPLLKNFEVAGRAKRHQSALSAIC